MLIPNRKVQPIGIVADVAFQQMHKLGIPFKILENLLSADLSIGGFLIAHGVMLAKVGCRYGVKCIFTFDSIAAKAIFEFLP